MNNIILSNNVENSIDKMEKVPLKEIFSDNVFPHNTELKKDEVANVSVNSPKNINESYNYDDFEQENIYPSVQNNTFSCTLTQDIIGEATTTEYPKPRTSLLLNFDPLFFKNTPSGNCSFNLKDIDENEDCDINTLTDQLSNICIHKIDKNVSNGQSYLTKQKCCKFINIDDTLDQTYNEVNDHSLGNTLNKTQNLNETVDLSNGSNLLNTANLNLESNDSSNTEIGEFEDINGEKILNNTLPQFENSNDETKRCSEKDSTLENELDALLLKYNRDPNITDEEISNADNRNSTSFEHETSFAANHTFDTNSITDISENAKESEYNSINISDTNLNDFPKDDLKDVGFNSKFSELEDSKIDLINSVAKCTSPNITDNKILIHAEPNINDQELMNHTSEQKRSISGTQIIIENADVNSLNKNVDSEEVSNEEDVGITKMEDIVSEPETLELDDPSESKDVCANLQLKRKNENFEELEEDKNRTKELQESISNSQLQEENELKLQLPESQTMCSNLELQLKQKNECVEELKEKLEEEKNRTKELQESIENLQLQESNELKLQLHESQTTCSNLGLQLKQKNECFEELKEKLEEEKNRKMELQESIKNLQLQENNELKLQLQEFQAACSNLKLQLNQKTEGFDVLKGKLEEEKNRTKELQESITDLQLQQSNELKLQLRESQEVCSNLELQLKQKNERFEELKDELQEEKKRIKELQESSESSRLQEDNELKLQLRESQEAFSKLEVHLKQRNEGFEELKEKLEEEKNRTTKILEDFQIQKDSFKNDLSKCNSEIQNYRKVMEEYEIYINKYFSQFEKLRKDHEVVNQHLTNLELAFSDVHQKYERSKKVIEGYKSNENALLKSLAESEDSIAKSEQKYETLKTYAKDQITKCNQEILLVRQQYESEIHKLNTTVKRLEIKNSSLQELLDQKKKECTALTILCDEVTGTV